MSRFLRCLPTASLLALIALPTDTAALAVDIGRQKASIPELGKQVRAKPAAVAEELLAITKDDELDKRLVLLAQAAQQGDAHDALLQVVDHLIKRQDLRADLIAAELLLNLVDAIPTSAYGTTKELLAFPGSVCTKAAGFLDHPNPVVQALGEWTIALRVRLQDSGTKILKTRFVPSASDQAWYDRWQARPAERTLDDDYARQLIQLGRHRSVDGVQKAIAAVAARIEKLRQAEGSRTKEAQPALTAYANALKQAQKATDLAPLHAAYLELRRAARAVTIALRADFPTEGFTFFTCQSIPGGTWNVNVAVAEHPTPGGDIWVKRSADPAAPATPLLKDALGAGSIRGLDLDWEAANLVFSFWHNRIDAKEARGYQVQNAHIYRMPIAGGAPTQLTKSPGDNDVEPCFLPDGGYVFASDRSSFGNQCAGPFIQDKRCTTLFRLPPGQGKEPHAISNNKDFDRHPHVLNDGTVAFMHWEYQERSLYNTHALWVCRPDGTSMDALYKQHISEPKSMRDAVQAPNSPILAATVQGHHDGHNGPVVLVNPTLGINNEQAMWLLTPGVRCGDGGNLGPLPRQIVPEGGVENRGGSFINPFPISDKAFIAGADLTDSEAEFAIYYIDVWGNRELLHRDRTISCFQPHPLRPRQRPPVIPDRVKPDATCASVFVENVYRDLPGVERGAVKYLRISESLPLPAPVDYDDPRFDFNHLHYLPGDATASHFGYWSWSPTRTVGTVDVAADGSAYFQVPAGRPVYLQALDADHTEVRRMRSSFTLQRGEFRGCFGCHESRLEGSSMSSTKMSDLLKKPPQKPVPPTWGESTVLDYRQHIQPIFDQHCVSCHGVDKPAGGIELTTRTTGGFLQSYRSLWGLKWGDPTPVNDLPLHQVLHPEAANDAYVGKGGREAMSIIRRIADNQQSGQLVAISNRVDSKAEITQPYQFGSAKSKLVRVLLDDAKTHRAIKAAMSSEQWLMLVTWIDHNANYHSTVMDKSAYMKDKKTIVRVPIRMTDPWIPGDRGKIYLNDE